LCALLLEGSWTEIPERRVASLPVVEDLDVLEEVGAGQRAGGPDGHTVREARSREDEMGVLADSRAKLVVVDLRLPGAGAVAVIQRVRGEPSTRDVPIIAVAPPEPRRSRCKRSSTLARRCAV
jgi:CheY-like chemotaxis protein